MQLTALGDRSDIHECESRLGFEQFEAEQAGIAGRLRAWLSIQAHIAGPKAYQGISPEIKTRQAIPHVNRRGLVVEEMCGTYP